MPRQSPITDTNIIYCGDCLERLKKIPDGCVDLIYIDPPFNSNRNYEVFWGEKKEIRAFEDRHASTQAYIDFMRPRCVELSRVLKGSGTFYYHCDWHASHYVKVMLDQVFGEGNFLNEIIWRRTNARTEDQQWPRLHDTIFVYTGGGKHTFAPLLLPGDLAKAPHTLITGPDGLKYNTKDLTGPGITKDGESGRSWRGFNPTDFGRHWGYAHSQMDEWDKAGRIHWPKSKGKAGGFPRLLDEKPFEPLARMVQVGDVWTDIDRLNQTAKERVGYPTQKPLALLERIIKVSSRRNEIVLDAFCGCGTALEAAQNLGRQWIGIDVSPTACRVVAKRIRDRCGLLEDEALWRAGRGFVVRDLPWDEATLRKMPPLEFENWAIIALGGIPNKTQIGDMGIDGRIYPVSSLPKRTGKKRHDMPQQMSFLDEWYPVQVKQRDKVGRPDVDAFEAVMMREERTKGFFVSFDSRRMRYTRSEPSLSAATG